MSEINEMINQFLEERADEYLSEASKKEADELFDQGLIERNRKKVYNKDYHKFMASDGHHPAGTGNPKTRDGRGSGIHDSYSTNADKDVYKILGRSENKGKYKGAEDAYRKTIRKAMSDPTEVRRKGQSPSGRYSYLFPTDAEKKTANECKELDNKINEIRDKYRSFTTVHSKKEAEEARKNGEKIITSKNRKDLNKKLDKLDQKRSNLYFKGGLQTKLIRDAKYHPEKMSPSTISKLKKMYPDEFKEYTETKINIHEFYEAGLISEDEKFELLNMLEESFDD